MTLAEPYDVKPSRWRRQHGRTEAVPEQVVDAAGNIGAPYRGLTLLDDWERSGRITAGMHDAGDTFHRLFHLAALDPMAAADMGRVGGARGPAKHRGSLGAQDDVNAALDALGGSSGQFGSCAWLVLGCEISLQQFAARWRWRGEIMDHKKAGRVLERVLVVLSALENWPRHQMLNIA